MESGVRIVTWNVNGMRAALRKNFAHHLEELAPDVLLLQEVRATPDQLPPEWAAPTGWNVVWHPAEKAGYAGTAVWSRHAIELVGKGVGAVDPEGRVLRVRTGGVQVGSVYLPSGSSGPERQASKEAWMTAFAPWAAQVQASDEPVILGGDLNIAHTENDIWNPKGNAKLSGFLPHERAWFGEALLAAGWRDLVREHVGPVVGPYSWWSNRGQARALNRGWRIDYLLGNAAAGKVKAASVHRAGGLETSDHAPVVVDLDL